MVLLPCLWPVYSVVDDTSQAQLTRVAVHRLRTVILSPEHALKSPQAYRKRRSRRVTFPGLRESSGIPYHSRRPLQPGSRPCTHGVPTCHPEAACG